MFFVNRLLNVKISQKNIYIIEKQVYKKLFMLRKFTFLNILSAFEKSKIVRIK